MKVLVLLIILVLCLFVVSIAEEKAHPWEDVNAHGWQGGEPLLQVFEFFGWEIRVPQDCQNPCEKRCHVTFEEGTPVLNCTCCCHQMQ